MPSAYDMTELLFKIAWSVVYVAKLCLSLPEEKIRNRILKKKTNIIFQTLLRVQFNCKEPYVYW